VLESDSTAERHPKERRALSNSPRRSLRAGDGAPEAPAPAVVAEAVAAPVGIMRSGLLGIGVIFLAHLGFFLFALFFFFADCMSQTGSCSKKKKKKLQPWGEKLPFTNNLVRRATCRHKESAFAKKYEEK
jgi:hypothetical protein